MADPHEITPGERMVAGALAGASAQVSCCCVSAHNHVLQDTELFRLHMPSPRLGFAWAAQCAKRLYLHLQLQAGCDTDKLAQPKV